LEIARHRSTYAKSDLLQGAVLTADGGPVEIGANCVIMENAEQVDDREDHSAMIPAGKSVLARIQ
jgi:hypothetical protein